MDAVIPTAPALSKTLPTRVIIHGYHPDGTSNERGKLIHLPDSVEHLLSIAGEQILKDRKSSRTFWIQQVPSTILFLLIRSYEIYDPFESTKDYQKGIMTIFRILSNYIIWWMQKESLGKEEPLLSWQMVHKWRIWLLCERVIACISFENELLYYIEETMKQMYRR